MRTLPHCGNKELLRRASCRRVPRCARVAQVSYLSASLHHSFHIFLFQQPVVDELRNGRVAQAERGLANISGGVFELKETSLGSTGVNTLCAALVHNSNLTELRLGKSQLRYVACVLLKSGSSKF